MGLDGRILHLKVHTLKPKATTRKERFIDNKPKKKMK